MRGFMCCNHAICMVSFATTLYARFHSQPRCTRGFICNPAICVVSLATTLYTWFHSQPRYIRGSTCNHAIYVVPHATTLYRRRLHTPPPPQALGSKFICNHAICMVSFATTLYTWFHMQPRYIDDVFIPPPTPLGPGIKIHSQPRYMHGLICNHPIYVVSFATTLYMWFHSQPRYIAWFHMQPRYIDDVFIPLPPPSGLGSKFTHNHDICMVSFATTLYTWFHMQPRYIDDVLHTPPTPLGPGIKIHSWFHSQPRYTRGFICNHAI